MAVAGAHHASGETLTAMAQRPAGKPRPHKLNGPGLQALVECGIGDCPWYCTADEAEDAMRAFNAHADHDHCAPW